MQQKNHVKVVVRIITPTQNRLQVTVWAASETEFDIAAAVRSEVDIIEWRSLPKLGKNGAYAVRVYGLKR